MAQPPSPRPARRRGAERDEAIRHTLRPLAEGERPAPLVVATLAAVALGLVNLGLLAAGQAGRTGPLAVYCVLMLALAAGMWTRRYGAVLAFQCLLAIAVATGVLFLLRASSLVDLLICFGLIVPPGWLFWKLIRVLARIQAPREPGTDPADEA
ncbi:hypothetical protein FSW04_04670 [Baekduia soli]|uniref:Uncharacterized protein n=1 Tax=Baekduia soli TaxID=496014 RepID=A0A5B8U1R1_9ACTN|nr:hypothetical protein [Baekduia soli]QEC46953.1 hypothetical protein FSW04_04670 [Baekduia soli]